MATGKQSSGKIDRENQAGKEVSLDSAQRILQDYAEETWDIPEEVPEVGTITSAKEEICRKEITRELRVEEERMVEEHSPSYHAEFDAGSYFVDAPVEERETVLPSDYVEETLRFFVPGSEEKSNCSQCSSRGRIGCDSCRGQGNVRCRSCRGTGTKTDSDGDKIRCSKCNGNGNRPCRTCDGVGDVTCGRCDGSGQTVKFEYFERSFTPNEEVEVISESVPGEYLLDVEGQHRSTDELPTAGTVVAREKEVRDIPVTVVEYEYGEKEYQLFEIEHEIIAPSHPRDKKKWMMAAGAMVAVLTIAAGVYVFVL